MVLEQCKRLNSSSYYTDKLDFGQLSVSVSVDDNDYNYGITAALPLVIVTPRKITGFGIGV
jgi:hypothetical protein